MDEKIASDLIDQIVLSNRKYSMIVAEIGESGSWEECGFKKDKLLQMMALSFDILDSLEKKFPHLTPDTDGKEH